MARFGMCAKTGQPLIGWSQCLQSIQEIIMTEIGERLQVRDFGTDLPRFIDRPQNRETILDMYVSVVEALEPRVVEGKQLGEPGFILTQVDISAGVPGEVSLYLDGVYFENGHIGDYSDPSRKNFTITVRGAGAS